jgi:hypothetical protein
MTATNQPDRSPAPGIIPDPVHIHDDLGALTVATGRRGGRKSGRRNPLRIAAARVMSALRGDKYMVDAHPAAASEDAAGEQDARSRAGKA